MPRDANGNYTLPPGINPVIPGTDIEADWANPTLDDVANALTDSLSRTGSGGMQVPFKFGDGTTGAPSVTWTNQPQAGLYRAANDDIRYVINGVDVLQLRPTAAGGVAIPGVVPFTVGGPVVLNGAVALNGGATINGAAVANQNDAIAYAIALG